MNRNAKWIVVAVLAVSMLGLCALVGRVGWQWATSAKSPSKVPPAWSHIVAEKNRLRQQMREDLQALESKYGVAVPEKERWACLARATAMDRRLGEMVFAVDPRHGAPPWSFKEEMGNPLYVEAVNSLTTLGHVARNSTASLAAEERAQRVAQFRLPTESGPQAAEREARLKQEWAQQQVEADHVRTQITVYYATDKPSVRRTLPPKEESILAQMRTLESNLRTSRYDAGRLNGVMDQFAAMQSRLIQAAQEEEEQQRKIAQMDALSKDGADRLAEQVRIRREKEGESGFQGLPTGAYTIGLDGKPIPLTGQPNPPVRTNKAPASQPAP